MTNTADYADNSAKLVTVFGGSGFLGRYVVKALANRGYRVRIACRRPDLAGHLRPVGTVGQVHPVQANVRYPDSVAHALEGAHAVVNLVGILSAYGNQRFSAVHARGARAIAEAAKIEGIHRFVQLSAIGADHESDIAYRRTKGEGEAGVRENLSQAVILRPSLIFGAEDEFFNRFARMASISPVLPLIGGGLTKFQPVYVGDVAEVVARGVEGHLEAGTIYELGGPQVASFRDCMELMLETIHRKTPFVNVPFPIAKIQGAIIGLLPKPPLTKDQVRLLESDNVVSQDAMKHGYTLEGLGINPQSMEAVLPTYLTQYRPYGQFASKPV